jgi:hypothetical protein
VAYGPGYGVVKRFAKQLNDSLSASPLFSDLESHALGVATKHAPNLRDILFS